MISNRIFHSKPSISKNDNLSVLETLRTGFVGQGGKVEEVNSFFCSLLKKKKSFYVNSGTSAFFLALKGLGIKENDEIILPNYLCGSLYSQIKSINAVPVLIDTLENSFFLSSEDVIKAITKKTKAIVINHLFGHFDPSIFKLTSLGIPIIEDITHALLAKNNNIVAGFLGDVTIASFGSTKFITSGVGGIISFKNANQAKLVDVILDHDYLKYPSDIETIRYNFKLGDLNASLLLSQLNQIESFIEKRRNLAKLYYKKLNVPTYPEYNQNSVYYRFFIRTDKNKLRIISEHLKKNNIDAAQGAVTPNNKNFKVEGYFPNSDKIWSELLSIPIYPNLSLAELNKIIKVINSKK